MSPSENNPSPEDVSAPKPTLASGPVDALKTPRKKLSKKSKIALLVAGWLLLLAAGAGAAFLLKPAPEIVYTDAIVAAYKFSGQEAGEVIDIVDDLDYYGYYTTNPITFIKLTDDQYKYAYIISGLKDKTVEDKINNRIKELAGAPGGGEAYMTITANYFNILSCYINYSNAERHDYLTFDLNTGEELNFDDLFAKNSNLTALLFNSFYDTLSTNLQFEKLAAQRRLDAESYAPDPTNCMAMYCPYDGETYDSLRALIAEYDNRMANIDQTAINVMQEYLSGEKKFYLNSFGPTLVLSDGTNVDVELKNNLRYAVYLKNYRSAKSLFEDDSIAEGSLFFTESPTPYTQYSNEETDKYLFNYTEGRHEDDISPATYQAFRDYLKNKGLSAPGDAEKFRYISANGTVTIWDDVRIGYATVCASEMDKSYYDSVYKKVIIDSKVQRHWLAPAKAGHYDEDRITVIPIGDDNTSCYQQIYMAITDSGEVLEDVNDILVNPLNTETWESYINRVAYNYVCTRTWEPKCYTEEERKTHELRYIFSSGAGVDIRIKDDDSATGWTHLYHFKLSELPRRYINPAILVK